MPSIEDFLIGTIEAKVQTLDELKQDILEEFDNLNDAEKKDKAKVKDIWRRCQDLILKGIDTVHQCCFALELVSTGNPTYTIHKNIEYLDDSILGGLYDFETKIKEFL